MFEDERSVYLKVQLVAEDATLAFVELSPLIALPLLWLAIVRVYSWIGRHRRCANFYPELLFFGLAGSAGAFINQKTQGTLLENMIPSLIMALTFALQLVGLTRGEKGPLRTSGVFLAGGATAVCFVLASRYLDLLMG